MVYPMPGANFVSSKLLLPLFLTSRNRIRTNRFFDVRRYIASKVPTYASSCVEKGIDNEDERNDGTKEGGPLKNRRPAAAAAVEESWKLAPNRYDVPGEVGLSRKGMKGAFWSKLKRTPIGGRTGRLRTAFYELPRDSERFRRRCHRHKGGFLTDPRRRRPSSRMMVSSILTCWRDPNEPGPASYFAGIFTHERSQIGRRTTPAAYEFLRRSCVPVTRATASVKTSTSFDPGPGRYNPIEDEGSLRIALEFDRQKRLKFRRLPFKRLYKHRQLTVPPWRHIFGFGFTSLFRGPPLRPPVAVSKKKPHKLEREVHLFPSFEYIRMINKPNRLELSIRTEEVPRKPKTMRYNCMVKVIIRRQLRSNKKIAFNSGMPRFKDADVQASKKTDKPQPLVNHPVMRVHPGDIKSKLHALPQRLRGVFNENRIRPFKFQPFPPVKLLLDAREVHSEYAMKADMYPRQLNPVDFFKEEFIKR